MFDLRAFLIFLRSLASLLCVLAQTGLAHVSEAPTQFSIISDSKHSNEFNARSSTMELERLLGIENKPGAEIEDDPSAACHKAVACLLRPYVQIQLPPRWLRSLASLTLRYQHSGLSPPAIS
jgi:hypothetical protein